MKKYIIYGLTGGIAGILAGFIGTLSMPVLTTSILVGQDGKVDERLIVGWDKAYEFLPYFFLGAIVCAVVSLMSSAPKGPNAQFRSFFLGALIGGIFCALGNAAVDLIQLRMAHGFSPDYRVTMHQQSAVHDVTFLLYYAIVPFSLCMALAISVGLNRFTLIRGLIATALSAVIGFFLAQITFELIIPFLLMQAMSAKSVEHVDLSAFVKGIMVSHLFGLGLGAAIAFAVAEAIYKPAWLRGVKGYVEGHNYPVPGPTAAIGFEEGMSIRIAPDGYIAPFHAQIDTENGRHLLRPVMAEVRVNGAAVAEHWLQDNDHVQLGTYAFRYRTRINAAPPSAPMPAIELARAPMPEAADYVLEDPMGGRHPVPPGVTLLGREVDHGISLPWEATISRSHAELTRNGDVVFVSDLGSSNGTYVNGVAVTGRVAVREGDELRLGKCNLRLRKAGTRVKVSV